MFINVVVTLVTTLILCFLIHRFNPSWSDEMVPVTIE
jgi:hypothetical protein